MNDGWMVSMYQKVLGHFGLRQNPFALSPNSQSFHSTSGHDEALLQLVFGVETRQGLMVLTGEPGSGKTTILRYFLEWLQQKHGYSTAYIFYTLLTSEDLLRLILRDFGIPCDARSKGELLTALAAWLLQRNRLGDCPVILIDEAQALTTSALEEVRMLLNLEVGGVKLVQIVLAGQPRLEQKLHRRQLAELRQRMVCHCQLPLLTLEETASYIVKRLAWAGSHDTGLFAPETVHEIFRYSSGNPRVINLICEHALISSYADRRNAVDLADVAAVAKDFELGGATDAGQVLPTRSTFCRVIPFPQLSAATPGAPSEEVAAALEVAPLEPEKQDTSGPATPDVKGALPASIPGWPANASRPETIISRLSFSASLLRSRILLYSRSVGSSFAQDGRMFVEQCLEWLNAPKGPATGAAAARHRAVRSVRRWLMAPSGSRTIISRPPRIPSARQKHS
jgi:general secretion pathway protein A